MMRETGKTLIDLDQASGCNAMLLKPEVFSTIMMRINESF